MADQEDLGTKMLKNFIAGVIAVPTSMALRDKIPSVWSPMFLFAGSMFGVLMSTFLGNALKSFDWKRCVFEAFFAAFWFFCGGCAPLFIGLIVPGRLIRIPSLVLMTALVTALGLILWADQNRTTRIPLWVIWSSIIVTIAGLFGHRSLLPSLCSQVSRILHSNAKALESLRERI